MTFPIRFGNYLLLDRVADGGMAQIFRAVEETRDSGRRFVIIKRIRREHVGDPDFIEFFLSESRVSLKLTHPNLPQYYREGQHQGLHYLSMEYIRGHNLLDIIRAAIRARHPLSVNTVVSIALGVSAALEHAHGLRDVDGSPMGVIHRDVTPQNIMVSTEGVVKLIDFGIVRSTVQLHRTRSGIVKGKLAYMAPEQLEGRDALDHRADLFALGVVMWETLVGRPLFRGPSELDTVDRIRNLRVPDPRLLRPDVPPQVSAVVLKALERDPGERYGNATEMMRALEGVAEHCQLVPWLSRLRREVATLLPAPELPEVPPEPPDPERDAVPRPATCDPDTKRVIAGELPPPPIPGASRTGLAADPLLLYFLRQSGARIPAHGRASVRTAAPADAPES